jgi:predicted HTH transcriptional regulator
MKQRYEKAIEELMKAHYSRMSEKDRRLYAALESKKLGWGGQKYIRQLLQVGQKTIERGLRELANPDLLDKLGVGQQRLTGGGRKKKSLLIK